MKDRIIQLIETEKLTAAEFADRIGVQRSSVSHVLNGRNNPGFSFIQKILETYPKLNSRWLLMGDGNIYLNSVPKTEETSPQQNLFSTKPIEPIVKEKTERRDAEKINIQSINTTNSDVFFNSNNDRKIVKVLIFYSDQTFEDFRPAK